jgi:hypothetical protein
MKKDCEFAVAKLLGDEIANLPLLPKVTIFREIKLHCQIVAVPKKNALASTRKGTPLRKFRVKDLLKSFANGEISDRYSFWHHIALAS